MATFFLLQHLCQKFFLRRVSATTIIGVGGDKAYLDTILYVISFCYRLTQTSWKNPEIYRHQSRKIKKRLVILMKNFFLTPSKSRCRVSNPTFLGEIDHDEPEYAVFLPNLLTTFFLI